MSTLSVQLYSARDALAEDRPGTLSRIAEIGFTTVELFGFVELADEYARLLPQRGLTALSGHAHLVGEDLDAVLGAAKALGMRTVVDPRIDVDWNDRAGVAAAAAGLNATAAAARDHGIQIGYHNHAQELEGTVDGTPALEVLASLLDEDVILEVDTFWAEVGGVAAPALLRRLGKRVTYLHVKDGTLPLSKETQTVVGAGALDVPAIVAAAPDAVRVIEFDEYAGDIFEALRASYEYVSGLDA